MRSLVIAFSILLCGAFAQASGELSVSDFQNANGFESVRVISFEKVFSDELAQEDVYKVNFIKKCEKQMGDCLSNNRGCEYVTVDTYFSKVTSQDIKVSGVSCEKDLEEVLDPTLYEEY